MQKKTLWIWESYLVFISVLITRKFYFFISFDSQNNFYFYFLNSFYYPYIFNYFLNYMHVIFELIHCVVLLFFIYQIRFKNTGIFKTLLCLRVVFFFCGYTYELNHLIALYLTRPVTAVSLIVGYILLFVPSYIGCFIYAFRQNNMPAKD